MSKVTVNLDIGNGEEVTFEYSSYRIGMNESPAVGTALLFAKAIEDAESYLSRRGVSLDPFEEAVP